ncbi:MAG: hypothetical protein JSS38_16235 [Nitrospira sp.]|nr:hypothetical protein [Nitrospira sp.]
MSLPTFMSSGKPISYEIFQPSGAGPFPAIVIVHGTMGMGDTFGGKFNPFKKAITRYGERT